MKIYVTPTKNQVAKKDVHCENGLVSSDTPDICVQGTYSQPNFSSKGLPSKTSEKMSCNRTKELTQIKARSTSCESCPKLQKLNVLSMFYLRSLQFCIK